MNTQTQLSDRDFAALAQFLAREAGLVFEVSRRPGLTSVVGERLEAAGVASVTDYLALVRRPEGAHERQRLLDAVTIQETHFYRDRAQIEALRVQLLPDLMRRAARESRPLRIWSAGCSTGEEPYTLAMLAFEVREALRLDVRIEIHGTDVSAAAIEVARAATYAGRTIDLAEEGAVARWFRRLPGGEGLHQVREELRAVVDFQVHNLVTDPPPLPSGLVDLVVCRNVTIYFARETTRELVERFHGVLRPGGFLVLGHAETLWQVSDAFALVPTCDAFAYRKDAVPAQPTLLAATPPWAQPTGSSSTTGSAATTALTGAGGTAVTVPGAERLPAQAPTPRRRQRAVSAKAARRARRAADPLLSAATASISRATVPQRTRSAGVDALIAARQAWAEGRYTQVVELTGRAVQADPLLADAHVLDGQARSTLGDDIGALESLRKAVYLEPSAGHAHFLLAGALSRLGQPGAAARSFRAAAASLPLVSPEQIHFLLDGRDVNDLVALCGQLADASERAAAVSGRSPR